MDEILSSHAGKIRACRSGIVSRIETSRSRGCSLRAVREDAAALVEAFSEYLEVEQSASRDNEDSFRSTIPRTENIYMDWRSILQCFNDTLRMAYLGSIPSSNLALDDILAELEAQVGEPLSDYYARLQTAWSKHLESYPWDAFLSGVARHVDAETFQNTLEALERGDEFDTEDSVENLTGQYRQLFKNYLNERSAEESDKLAHRLWTWPEILIANDYWNDKYHSKLTDILIDRCSSRQPAGFAKVKAFFSGRSNTRFSHQAIVSSLNKTASEDRSRILRCLIMHPDQGIRRYAVTNLDLENLWKSATPAFIPCAALLSLSERIAGSEEFDDNFRKIFFDTVHRRLLMLTTRSEVLYARGIIRIFSQFDFFMEDNYFEKLMKLMDYMEDKERHFGIKEPFLAGHIAALKDAKQKTGSLESALMDFSRVPPVILRKIARDGHFWYELAGHPVYKVARETIPHINSPDRALRIATKKNVNQEVIRAVGKKKALFANRTNKLAVLTNPRTPPGVSMEYLPDLSKSDMDILMRTSTIHPELRNLLRKKLLG